MNDDRLPWPNAVLAASAYHRVGWSWQRIGKHLGYDKDRLRKAVAEDAQSRQPSPLINGEQRPAHGVCRHPMSAFIKPR